jgi:hypothetical protein
MAVFKVWLHDAVFVGQNVIKIVICFVSDEIVELVSGATTRLYVVFSLVMELR